MTETTESQKLWYLKNYNVFQGIPLSDLKKVATGAKIKECKSECSLYAPYDATDNVYILKRGEVSLYHEKDGQRYVFDTLGPGSVFGSINSDAKKYGHFAMGGPGTCVCIFPIDEFLALIAKYPEATLKLMKHMSQKIIEYQVQFHNTQSRAEELVLHELERMYMKRQQNFIGKFIERPLRLTHKHIAELTGLNRVTVTRSMKKLQELGAIQQDSRTGIIEIMNLKKPKK